MIYDDPTFFDAYLRSDLEQLRRFLSSRAAPADQYRLAPQSRADAGDADANATLVVSYAPEPFRRYRETAWITWPTASGSARVRTSLSEAEFIVAFAFDRPENLRLLTEMPADIDPALAMKALGIDQKVLKPHVGQYLPGSYVAPEGNGWAYFLVEPYGETVVLADGPQSTPLLQLLASDKLAEESNLAGRMAEFVVPIAPEDTRG